MNLELPSVSWLEAVQSGEAEAWAPSCLPCPRLSLELELQTLTRHRLSPQCTAAQEVMQTGN